MSKDVTVLTPCQKTFSFAEDISSESIDEVCNKWIKEQSDNGTPVFLGKTFANHKNGRVHYVYMYSVKEIKKG